MCIRDSQRRVHGLDKMQARFKATQKIFSIVQLQIQKKISDDKQFYQEILTKLMVQGYIKLLEEKVKIRCLKKDVDVIKKALPQSIKEFKQIMKKELNRDFPIKVEVDEDKYLIERKLEDNSNLQVQEYDLENYKKDVISKSEDDKKCFGGVIMTNDDGNIIFKNTFDIRVDLCFQDSLPQIREIMFQQVGLQK
eukprot:TRINITY_DN7386_c0_g1_i6.p2 TRINITY_DN7386_c0_g1~~TRINITY_DN7386_c0_g1_i6.p2  ORF type:complete len:194 (-),score=47.40 TRINITY_DN7386_c0_g1_i6:122-703(-)